MPSRVTRSQRKALGILTLVAVAALIWIALPVGLGLFLGMLVAFTVEPLYQRLCAQSHRPVLSAVACAIGCTLAIAGALTALAIALAERGAALVTDVRQGLAPGGSLHRALDPLQHTLGRMGVNPGDLGDRLRDSASAAVGRAAGAVAAIAGMTMNALLTLFFVALTIYFVLVHWRTLTARAEKTLPLHPAHTRSLFQEFRRAGRTILLGTVVTGIAQGVLAAIAYAVFGVPHATLLGALTTVASLVPAIGTLLVWVPAGAYLIATGHLGAGVGLLVSCALTVIVLCDYVVRPRLVGRGEKELPTLLTFIALFGGVEVFGVVGLVLGPVVVSLAVALLRTWEWQAQLAVAETRPGFGTAEEPRPSAPITSARTRTPPHATFAGPERAERTSH